MAASSQYLALRDALLKQAALVDDFLPRDLLREVVPAELQTNILLRGQLTSALREKCTARGERWQLRPIDRRKILGTKAPQSGLPDSEISAALLAQSIYEPEKLRRLVEDSTDIAALSTAVTTLEQAGPAAPGHSQLLALSSKLDQLRRIQATAQALGTGFVGRTKEVSELVAALDAPQRDKPLQTLHIQGLPGMGKTYLLEEISRLARERPHIVMVRLDFDRSALSAGNLPAILDEISRQIGTAIPQVAMKLHDIRMRTSGRRTQTGGGQGTTLPFDLLHRMIEVLDQHDRQLLFLLDTLEVLHGHGATFVYRLMDALDLFADKGLIAISMISAGRGAVFGPEDDRVRGLIHLEKLDDEVTEAILIKRGVPQDQRARIATLSEGNPLRLILVARALQDGETHESLGDADIASVGNGYLYRAILSRVPTDLREIASFGLILPELDAQALVDIIGPALEKQIDAPHARDLLDQLAQQRWLVRELGQGKFAHMPEVRGELLELTYAEGPDKAWHINKQAAEVRAKADPVLALYHRLQMTRNGSPMMVIDPVQARQITPGLLEDLPEAARDAVLRAQGLRSRVVTQPSIFKTPEGPVPRLAQKAPRRDRPDTIHVRADPSRAGGRLILVAQSRETARPDPGGLMDVRNMLEAGEQREATYLLQKLLATPFRFEGEAARLALTHQWRGGYWSMARTLFDLLPEATLDRATQDDIGLTGLALLEMWAEFRFDRLCARMTDGRVLAAARDGVALAVGRGLDHGALSMALLAADPKESGAGSILARHLAAPLITDRKLIDASTAIRDAFGLVHRAALENTDALPVEEFGSVIAPLNPYARPLRALLEGLSDAGGNKAVRDITALGGQVVQLAQMFASGIDHAAQDQARTASFAGEAVDLMRALGLTAEYATGYAFYSPIPDLPTIARAAARWQSATLGQWRYGTSKPSGWYEKPLDMLSQSRATRLLAEDGPAAAARKMLRIWDDPAAGPEGARTGMQRRIRGPYAALQSDETLPRRFALLEASNLPHVLHAPLVVLSGFNVPASEIF